MPKLGAQELSEVCAGVCVLKVTVPNTVIADVTTCSFGFKPKYHPFLPAKSAGTVAVLFKGMAYREFKHNILAPQAPPDVFSDVNQVLSVGLSCTIKK